MSESAPGAALQPVVCHLIESLEHGGAEALVCRLAAGLRKTKYRPIVCCLRGGPLAAQLEKDRIPVHCLGLRRRSIAEGPAFVLFVARVLTRLARLVRTERVAIIHAHLPDNIIWAASVGVLTGTPIVGTYHGLGILPDGRSRLDPRNALRRWSYRALARLSDRTIAVSAPVRDMLCTEVGLDERQTVLILNGVDTELYAGAEDTCPLRAELGLGSMRVIACVGRLIAAKGQRYLVDALPAVVAQHPDAALVLIGDGPERAGIEDRIRALGLGRHVRLVGERNDVPRLLALCEVFVLPSFAEGIPLSLIEAMAAGKPVVATAVPGNLDVVLDERYGVLVPPRDAGAIANAICALLADPARAREIGSNARARARAHFDIGRSLAATVSLYDEVVARRKPPRGARG
jgi:glycosyltransferase involved in cell wall biosynthesis